VCVFPYVISVLYISDLHKQCCTYKQHFYSTFVMTLPEGIPVDSVAITNKMELGNGIYYSTVQ